MREMLKMIARAFQPQQDMDQLNGRLESVSSSAGQTRL